MQQNSLTGIDCRNWMIEKFSQQLSFRFSERVNSSDIMLLSRTPLFLFTHTFLTLYRTISAIKS
jgi:hypothetical protein